MIILFVCYKSVVVVVVLLFEIVVVIIYMFSHIFSDAFTNHFSNFDTACATFRHKTTMRGLSRVSGGLP